MSKREGLLILSRRVGESIVIGNDVTITVLGMRPYGLVRLGISAPRAIEIDRKEVWLRKQAALATTEEPATTPAAGAAAS